MKTKVIALLSLLTLSLVSAQATVMYTSSGTTTQPAAYGQSALSFQVNTSITVTDLSFFGISMGGGDNPYVQLWNDTTDTLLGGIAFATGEAGAGWNTKALASSITLNPGTVYQLQTTVYFADLHSSLSPDFAFAPEITSVTSYGGTGFGGWTPPSAPSTLAANPSSNANMVYTVAVPEPSTYALLGLGAISLFVLRRRVSVKA